MKKELFLLLIGLAVLAPSFAQDTIPNAGFENWTGTEPDDWGVANAKDVQFANCAQEATEAGDFHSGSSGLLLNTVKVVNGGDVWRVAGTAVSGGRITLTEPYVAGGFAYTLRPTNLQGYCKYLPQQSSATWPATPPDEVDPATGQKLVYGVGSLAGISAGDGVGLDRPDIRITMYKIVDGTDLVTIGQGQLSPTNSTFGSFMVPIIYDTLYSDNPDLVQIVLASSRGVEAAEGSKFFVDSLRFDFTVGVGVAEIEEKLFNLKQNAPNPFSGTTSISFESKVAESVSFTVVDLLGQTVYTQEINAVVGENRFTFTSNLNSGTYFYSISDGISGSTKKMVVSK